MTKCTFHRYGPSGDVQKHDAMCLLPINIVNEKVYIFLWFWFGLLATVSILVLVYRALTIFYPYFRIIATHSHCRISSLEEIRDFLGEFNIGDWFMINLLSKNIDPYNFRALVRELKAELVVEENHVLDD